MQIKTGMGCPLPPPIFSTMAMIAQCQALEVALRDDLGCGDVELISSAMMFH